MTFKGRYNLYGEDEEPGSVAEVIYNILRGINTVGIDLKVEPPSDDQLMQVCEDIVAMLLREKLFNNSLKMNDLVFNDTGWRKVIMVEEKGG